MHASIPAAPAKASACFRPIVTLLSAAEESHGPGVVLDQSLTQQRLAVVLDDVCASVGEGNKRRQVLRNCNLTVQGGTLHMLLGANGCGKSTLLRAAGGLLVVESGRVITAQPAGFVFQNPDHQVVLPTAASDVAFGLGGYKLDEADVALMVDAAMAAVGLTGFQNRSSHTLSGGERQRLAVAGALVQAPAVLLLDELTSFLDGGDQAAVLRAVRAAVDTTGVTAIWVTHRLEELQWADGASFMDGGRVAVSGSVALVKNHLRSLGAPI